MTRNRALARSLAQSHLDKGDTRGWFEALYLLGREDPSVIPWADMKPNPNLMEWLNTIDWKLPNKKVLKIGCGMTGNVRSSELPWVLNQTMLTWKNRNTPEC